MTEARMNPILGSLSNKGADDHETYSASHIERSKEKYLLTLPGLKVPVRMLKQAQPESVRGADAHLNHPDIELASPTSTTKTVTDPTVKISWGPDTKSMVCRDAIDFVKTVQRDIVRGRKHVGETKRTATAEESTGHVIHDAVNDKRRESHGQDMPSATSVSVLLSPLQIPRLKPPPSTPPEQASYRYALSTPTLPTFHSFSDPTLVNALREEREKDPEAFDNKTRDIKRAMVAAKVERGGIKRLSQGDYNVELSSREDAARVEKWASRRGNGNGPEDLDFDADDANMVLSKKNVMPTTECGPELKGGVVKYKKHGPLPSPPHSSSAEASSASATVETEPENPGLIPTALPSDFELGDKVLKYTSSGSIEHQHSRTLEKSEDGQKVIIKTWIEISQEVVVLSPDKVGWSDVLGATRDPVDERRTEMWDQDTAAVDEDLGTDRMDGGDSDEDESDGEIGERVHKACETEELLANLAQIPRTGARPDANRVGDGGFQEMIVALRHQLNVLRLAGRVSLE